MAASHAATMCAATALLVFLAAAAVAAKGEGGAPAGGSGLDVARAGSPHGLHGGVRQARGGVRHGGVKVHRGVRRRAGERRRGRGGTLLPCVASVRHRRRS
jgi:hypothetical protein